LPLNSALFSLKKGKKNSNPHLTITNKPSMKCTVQCPEINIQYNTFHSKRSTTTLEIIILGESIQHELQRMIKKKDIEKKKCFEIFKKIFNFLQVLRNV